jgi:hypothetical protein
MRQFAFIQYALAALFFSLASAASTASTCFPAKKIAAQLGPMLSADAEIYIPNQADFVDVSLRWSKFAAPSYAAYVKVASEEDVQAIVCYSSPWFSPSSALEENHGVKVGHKVLSRFITEPLANLWLLTGSICQQEEHPFSDCLWRPWLDFATAKNAAWYWNIYSEAQHHEVIKRWQDSQSRRRSKKWAG